jgi:transposase, IS30 family
MAQYKQLTLEQRYQIQCLRQQKISQKQIANCIGVCPSTVSRELSRNRSGTMEYDAQSAYIRKKMCCKRACYKMNGSLKETVVLRLRDRYSPEQISGILALESGSGVLSHETIYKYIYNSKNTEHEPLLQYLRIRHKKKYKKRGQVQKRGSIPNRIGIENRPAVVEANTEIGHWEGDTVIGANHEGVLLTLVERVTKFTIIEKLPSKNAEFLAKMLIKRMSKSPIPVKTITFDNGKEFTEHQKISKALSADVYFATPYHSWERGLNENTNGLIRQYIPKSCPISIVKKSDVNWIQNQLNQRPRKTLGYLSPIHFAFKYKIALET